MIAASDPVEYIPSGHLTVLRHPESITSRSFRHRKNFLATLSEKFDGNDSIKPKEFWHVRSEAKYQEEELFCSGRLAVLSKGSQISNTLQTCYSCDTNIKHAIWCKFYLENKEEMVKNKSSEGVECICLVDSYNLKVFTEYGENYVSSLPFKVSGLWSTKYGILLEKSALPPFSYGVTMDMKNVSISEDTNTPVVFSLSHPLDEVCPVLMKHAGLTYMWDLNQQIVFINAEPSIGLIYDTKSGLHSIYKIRKSTTEECQFFSGNIDSTNPFMTSVYSPCLTIRKGNKTVFNSLGSPNTPFHSSGSSPSLYLSRSHSPMATISRCQSPTHPPVHFSKVHQTTLGLSMGQSRMAAQYLEFYPSKPILPELCLEHIWTETAGPYSERAHKVFLTTDLIGQTYLCYLVQNLYRLSLVRLEKSSDPDKVILGMVTTIVAKDAVSLPELKMIIVIDANGNIAIYSGISPIGKLHIPTLLPNSLANSYILPVVHHHHRELLSPFPRRSSLISPSRSRTPDIKFEEGLQLLSPVGAAFENMNMIDNSIIEHNSTYTLKNSVGNKFILEYGSGNFYKITLPTLKTVPLVSKCLKALKNILPRDLAMQLLSKWYVARNAPGPQDMSLQQEWNLFLINLFTLLGYDVNKVPIISISDADSSLETYTPINVSKKQKTNNNGSDDDWQYLVNSVTSEVHDSLSDMTGLKKMNTSSTRDDSVILGKNIDSSGKVVINSPFLQYLSPILFAFHLLYEELKLSKNLSESLFYLAQLLHQLSSDLDLPRYKNYYFLDFPSLGKTCHRSGHFKLDLENQKNIQIPSFMTVDPPSIFQTLNNLLNLSTADSYPYLPQINSKSKNLIELFSMFNQQEAANICELDYFFKRVVQLPNRDYNYSRNLSGKEVVEKIVKHFYSLGMNKYEIQNLPTGVSFIVSNIVHQCRENPPSDWSTRIYELVERQDLAALENKNPSILCSNQAFEGNSRNEIDGNDGMEFDYTVLKLRFLMDHRVREVRRLLNSSEPVKITIVQRPEISDHEFIEEQEKCLHSLCTRTMALPIGRGMFTLRTSMPVNTEQLPIPRLCLTGKAPPRGTTVELSHIDVPSNMNLWPLFHNGVATGLCIHPNSTNVDSTWIVYNKQQQGEFGIEHSGFLMALGLNGHLKNLAPFSLYEYLVECHEATSVGLLLGLSATHKSSMDVSMTKLLSLHVETLLPPTSIELNVQQNVQVAALMGVGLVYQQTNHRHIAHALLSEIGRPPGPEMKNCIDRESYSLTAGLALGLVVLGSGGGSDLANIPDSLHYYMVGGNVRPFCGSQKDKYKSPSYQIREGDSINIDVTSPGATVALGLMYLKTGNHAVAEWMSAPNTQYLLDFVRPDLLLLRILSKSLILWDEIEPSKTWVSSHVPEIVAKYKLQKPNLEISEPIDLETINQAYCNIIAGACMAMGLKYAGTENIIAFKTLFHFLKMFMTLTHKSVAALAGKATIETCLNVVLLASSVVMAGTGNIELLRIIRYLRTFVGSANTVVTYGSHVAMHMALGFLFLGGGSYSLSNDSASVAALLISLFPKFPTHSNDNRYHLQALRHFYVLACQSRLLLPRDIDNDQYSYAAVRLTYKDSVKSEGQKLMLRAPCLLPQLDRLAMVELDDERYWKITFEEDRNFSQLKRILEENSYLSVKQKAGCLSYTDDPQGFRTLLAQTLTTEEVIVWTAMLHQITSFTTDRTILSFVRQFLQNGRLDGTSNDAPLCFVYSSEHNRVPNQICEVRQKISDLENHFVQILIAMVYECVVRDKINFLPLWIGIYNIVKAIERKPSVSLAAQLQFLHSHRIYDNCYRGLEKLLNKENILANKQQLSLIMDKWESELSVAMRDLVKNKNVRVGIDTLNKFASYISYYQIPCDLEKLIPYIIEKFDQNEASCMKVYGSFRFHKLFTS